MLWNFFLTFFDILAFSKKLIWIFQSFFHRCLFYSVICHYPKYHRYTLKRRGAMRRPYVQRLWRTFSLFFFFVLSGFFSAVSPESQRCKKAAFQLVYAPFFLSRLILTLGPWPLTRAHTPRERSNWISSPGKWPLFDLPMTFSVLINVQLWAAILINILFTFLLLSAPFFLQKRSWKTTETSIHRSRLGQWALLTITDV